MLQSFSPIINSIRFDSQFDTYDFDCYSKQHLDHYTIYRLEVENRRRKELEKKEEKNENGNEMR